MEEKLRRPYKNQKQKDKELMLAYQQGILDERKEWKEKEKIFERKQYQIKRQKGFCFYMGEKLWRPMCAECQDFKKKIISDFMKMIDKEWTFFEDDLPHFQKGDVFIAKREWEEIKHDAVHATGDGGSE